MQVTTHNFKHHPKKFTQNKYSRQTQTSTMKNAFQKSFALLCLLASILPSYAIDAADNNAVERQLQTSGQFCLVSADVTCTVDSTGKNCLDIGMQPYGTCGPTSMTWKYEYCNLLPNNNVNPVAIAPESGKVGTQAMYRQEFGRPKLLMGTLGPGVCKEAYVYDTVDTCRKRAVAELRFEGW